MEMIPIIISVSMFAMIALIVSVVAQNRAKRVEALAAVQTRMLDKFGSAQEFVAFLQTPQGREFLGKTTEAETHPGQRIMGSIRTGIILTLLGTAFIVLSFSADNDMIIPGVLTLAIGLGFLISAGVSLRLSRSWGLMSNPDRELASQQ